MINFFKPLVIYFLLSSISIANASIFDFFNKKQNSEVAKEEQSSEVDGEDQDNEISEQSFYLKIQELDLPSSKDEFLTLENSIEMKINKIMSLISSKSYGPALKQAAELRTNVRKKIFFDYKSNEDITIRISSFDNVSNDSIVLNYLHGFFPEMLNFYKRVEMLYSYAMVKRFSSGGNILESDKELIQTTLAKVYNSHIIIMDENENTITVFEDDIFDQHFNYIFKRELDTYFYDLGYNDLNLEEIAKERKQKIIAKIAYNTLLEK